MITKSWAGNFIQNSFDCFRFPWWNHHQPTMAIFTTPLISFFVNTLSDQCNSSSANTRLFFHCIKKERARESLHSNLFAAFLTPFELFLFFPFFSQNLLSWCDCCPNPLVCPPHLLVLYSYTHFPFLPLFFLNGAAQQRHYPPRTVLVFFTPELLKPAHPASSSTCRCSVVWVSMWVSMWVCMWVCMGIFATYICSIDLRFSSTFTCFCALTSGQHTSSLKRQSEYKNTTTHSSHSHFASWPGQNILLVVHLLVRLRSFSYSTCAFMNCICEKTKF